MIRDPYHCISQPNQINCNQGQLGENHYDGIEHCPAWLDRSKISQSGDVKSDLHLACSKKHDDVIVQMLMWHHCSDNQLTSFSAYQVKPLIFQSDDFIVFSVTWRHCSANQAPEAGIQRVPRFACHWSRKTSTSSSSYYGVLIFWLIKWWHVFLLWGMRGEYLFCHPPCIK